MGITGNWLKDDMFPEVTKEVIKAKKDQERQIEKNKRLEEREKRLRKPFFTKGPTTKSKGKKLKVSAKAGARGLIDLL